MAPPSCRYGYDPLDRLASTSPMGEAPIARFYQKSRLATEIQGALQRTVFQHDDQLLAQQQYSEGNSETSLLVTDQQRSVLKRTDVVETESLTYTAYGHLPADSGLSTLLGFSGERRDRVTGHYLLGNGYRAFNPVLMRFNSPDSLSPFDEGGLNAYAYCQGDPVNFRDPTGHVKFLNPVLNTSPFIPRYVPAQRPRQVTMSRSSTVTKSLASSAISNTINRQPGAGSSPLPVAVSDNPMSISSSSRPSVAARSAASRDSIGSGYKVSDPEIRHKLIARVGVALTRAHKSSEVPGTYGFAVMRWDHFESVGKASSALAKYYKSMHDTGAQQVNYSFESMYQKYSGIETVYKKNLEEYTANIRQKFPQQTERDSRFAGRI
ncbi:RHS repeat-associated core domain-containing protein [Pseudomonas sp. Pseusp122]|uniref:RHS repeat-associated core domain-containing protein n=1 Tax=unclassified Pseudomonas TaxID=196821 RepID=UPI0039A40AA2